MSDEEIERLQEICEQDELDPEKIVTFETYSRLLMVYLIKNNLISAKFLWKRIPINVKQSYPELGKIWQIGQCLWKKQYEQAYLIVSNGEWSSLISPLMTKLSESQQQRMVNLIQRAYATISLTKFGHLIGKREEDAAQIASEQKWEITENKMIKVPKKTSSNIVKNSLSRDSENLLNYLAKHAADIEE